MKTVLQDRNGKHITSQIAAGMLRAVDRRYMQLFEEAKREWERNYARPEPSDACVSVRISSREANVLKRKQTSFAREDFSTKQLSSTSSIG